ncbi:MAG: hypothetical protein BAJALOKI2v1_800018 [Promethearchaeota archaeon]|nr:MAG: hypothetical protein BAJALOKI2v1_800018 [Candidatus Lokiarchaeota archaeon]
MAKSGKGAIVIAVLGLLIGASGLGFGFYIYFTYEDKLDYLDDQIDNLKDDLEAIDESLPIESNDTDSDTTLSDSGRLLQTKQVNTNSPAQIFDSYTTKEQMPDMNIQITTAGNSFLWIRFNTEFFLSLSAGFTGRTNYNISISFQGKDVSSARIHAYFEDPGQVQEETRIETIPIYLEYISDTLDAGTYEIKINWYSIWENIDSTTALTASGGSLTPVRTLIVQEFSS